MLIYTCKANTSYITLLTKELLSMGIDLNELRQEQTRLESQGQESFLNNFVRMPEGEGVVVVRILSPRKGQKLYCVTRTHKLGQKNFHCPQTLVNGKWQGFCPICNYYRNLWKEADKVGGEAAAQLQAEARGIKPLERYYYNTIVRSWLNPQTNEVEKDVGPKILSIGKQLHARIIRAILGDPVLQEPELGDVTDYTTGRDLKIVKRLRKSGAESFPNYDESKFLQPSALGNEKQIATWMETLHDLQALRQVKDAEELAKELRIFRGLEEDPALSFDVPSTVGHKTNGPVRESQVQNSPKPKKVDDDDESLADDDFLAELRNM